MTVKPDLNILEETQKLILKHGYQKVTMTDIASACQISRTTLYKSYSNKESVLIDLIHQACDASILCTRKILDENGKSFKVKLEEFFEVWTIQPASLVINLETGRDLLANVASYAPQAVDQHYAALEKMLTLLIEKEQNSKKDVRAEDLAHILALASKGLKTSANDIKDLKRMIEGLISMTVATLS